MLSNQNTTATGFEFSKDWSRAFQEENVCIQICHSLSRGFGFKYPLDRPGGEGPAIFGSGSAWFDGQEFWGFQGGEIKKPHLREIEALQHLEAGVVETQHPENAVATVLQQGVVECQSLGEEDTVEEGDVVLGQEKLLQAVMTRSTSSSERNG